MNPPSSEPRTALRNLTLRVSQVDFDAISATADRLGWSKAKLVLSMSLLGVYRASKLAKPTLAQIEAVAVDPDMAVTPAAKRAAVAPTKHNITLQATNDEFDLIERACQTLGWTKSRLMLAMARLAIHRAAKLENPTLEDIDAIALDEGMTPDSLTSLLPAAS